MMKRKLTRPFLALAILTSIVSAQAADRLLILAPHDLYPTWQWYANQRKINHPEIEFDVKDTDEIYKDYKYLDVRCPATGPRPASEVPVNVNRYPSESIYRWLQNYYSSHADLKYVVLGGAWLDVTDPVVHYHQDGTEINLGNAIPSMRVKPNIKEGGFYNPTDMYYACLNDPNETGHHWDPNNDGIYLVGNHGDGGEEFSTKGWADVAVSRMTMKPVVMDASVEFNPEFELTGGKRVLNQHQLITNFLYKVNRAEGNGLVGRHKGKDESGKDVYIDEYAEPFPGKNKLAITSTYLQNKACGLNDPKMLRDENEFFDGAPNMYAPEHPSTWEDTGPHMRRHVSEVAAFNRPVLETVSYHANNIYSKNAVGSAFSGAFNTYDREIGAVNGHGWAGGTGWFSAKTFSTCPGLTKINVVGISCETGYLDIYGNQNGKSVANLSLGESGMANVTKTGGVIASINNSRYGWVNWETDQLFGKNQSWRLHYWFYDGVVKGLNAGDAWLRMVQNYYKDFKYSHLPEAIPGQCYTQMMLFGDPLIAAVKGDHPNAVMSYEVPSGTTELVCEGNLLKVMKGMTVAGDKLEIGINGGVGGIGGYQTTGGNENSAPNESANAQRPNGLTFSGAPGELTFNNTREDAYFFVNKVVNAKKITFAGAGAIINTDQFVGLPDDGLVFEGKEGFVGKTARPNVIRANLNETTGLLTRYLPLTLNNTSLQFETYEAFKDHTGSTFATLKDSKLTFRINRWRGLGEGYTETIRGDLTLDNSTLAADYPAYINLNSETINVTGKSSIETTHGGTFKLNGPKRFVLRDGATLTIDAEFVQSSGTAALDFSGTGRLIVKNAKGLLGDVTIGEGIDLELENLPLANVTSLRIAAGNKIVLKKSGTFYQVVPQSSALHAEGVKVYLKEGEAESELNAEITYTGAIFESGTITAWKEATGEWTGMEQYFPDIVGDVATVTVPSDVKTDFMCFANQTTVYTFVSDTGARVLFDSLSIVGKTSFRLPSIFSARLYIAGGDFYGTTVTGPVIEIGAGGTFEAESISNGSAHPSEVIVNSDGTLVLNGAYNARLTLVGGAKLKAENGKALVWADQSSVVWPEDGKVIIDVSDFKATESLQPIITGVNADMAFLRHLETNRENVSLALNEQGDVCLVAVAGAHESWTKDEIITVGETPFEYVISKPQHFGTLTFSSELPNAMVKITVTKGGSLTTDEVRFNGITTVEVTDLKIGTGTLYATETTRVLGDSSGTLSMTATDTVEIQTPVSSWRLADGVQGVVYVGISDVKAERRRIFTIDADGDWPIGGFSVTPYDFEKGEPRSDFTIQREGTGVYLVPPTIEGKVTGEHKWSELKWIAYDGQNVSVENWDNVAEVKIVSEDDAAVVIMDGAPTVKLVTGGQKLTLKRDGDVKLPREIIFGNELTISGAMLPALDYVKGTGKLILDTGDITEIVIPGNIMPIEAQVEIKKGSTLRLAHQSYFQNKSANFKFISGDGTLELNNISKNGARFFMPAKELMFPMTLTFKLETELELQHIHRTNPLEVGNLCGSGTFGFGRMTPEIMLFEMGFYMNQSMGMDKWIAANCGTRRVRTIQSDVSEWTGWIPDWYGEKYFGINFDAKLEVAGSETKPSFSRRLVFSGKAADNASISCQGDKGADHVVTIESSGCFELNGYWNGTIENNGILVLGPKRVIKNKTVFSGNGKIATLGDQIDLTAVANFKNYTLAAGTYGEVVFAVPEADDFTSEIEVMASDAFTPTSDQELFLIAVKGAERKWQRVSDENFKNGKIYWLAKGGEDANAAITYELQAGESALTGYLGDQYLGAVTTMTLKGAEDGTSVVDAGESLVGYRSVLLLEQATLKTTSPLETKLGANPTGKIVFVVDDLLAESELMRLDGGFTYNPNLFTIEVVDKDGNSSDGYWTWTAQDGVLKYVITGLEDNSYLPRAFKFDGDLASWGSNGQNLGLPSSDKFVHSRSGYALTGHDQQGSDFEIGGHDWTVSWVARLSPTPNAVHFALGSKGAGGFALTTVSDSRVAISRWRGNQAATKLIEAEVAYATKKFNSYILSYRNGYYTLYVNGVKVGSEATKDVDGANGYSASVNWRTASIYGGTVNNTAASTAGALDDFRLYTVALSEPMIKAIAAEFNPWPDLLAPTAGEEITVDINEIGTHLFLGGEGTVRLTRKPGENAVVDIAALSGSVKLIIDEGVILETEMTLQNKNPLAGHDVVIEQGGRLVLNHRIDMYKTGETLAGVNFSRITGTGTIELRSPNCANLLKLPSSRKYGGNVAAMQWGEELSVCVNTKIVLDTSYEKETYPLVLRNLSGSGQFVYKPSDSGTRYVEIVQTERTKFSGTFAVSGTVNVVGDGMLVVNPTLLNASGITLNGNVVTSRPPRILFR